MIWIHIKNFGIMILGEIIQFLKFLLWCFKPLPKDEITFAPRSSIAVLEETKGKPIELNIETTKDCKDLEFCIGIQYKERNKKYDLKLIISSSEESLRKSIKK